MPQRLLELPSGKRDVLIAHALEADDQAYAAELAAAAPGYEAILEHRAVKHVFSEVNGVLPIPHPDNKDQLELTD